MDFDKHVRKSILKNIYLNKRKNIINKQLSLDIEPKREQDWHKTSQDSISKHTILKQRKWNEKVNFINFFLLVGQLH